MSNRKLASLQKSSYLEIVQYLWECGEEETHQEYPELSVAELKTANEYFNSLRCPDCFCGSCVGLSELSSSLDQSPEPLKPIADLAIKLGQREYEG